MSTPVARGVFASLLALAPLAIGFLACTGEPSIAGLEEPIRVRNGVFKEGPLPGSPPDPNGSNGAPPLVTAIETPSTILRPGQGEKTLAGRTSPGTTAVALGFADLGTGYWLIQVDGPDPLNAGELGFQAVLEIAKSAPPGLRELRLVAIDGESRPGTQRALPVCVPGLVPDNLNACDRAIAPPASVVSLAWDAPVDLDLVVVAPDGRVVDAKHPRLTGTASVPEGGAEGGTDASADAGTTTVASVDRDSNGACALDRVQRENLVFPETPPAGTYLVYANLFDACERTSVRFDLTVYARTPTPDGKTELTPSFSKGGTLLAVDANGGAKLGTFVTEVTF